MKCPLAVALLMLISAVLAQIPLSSYAKASQTDQKKAQAAAGAIAFYYGPVSRVESLARYDRVVIQPDQISTDQLQALVTLGTEVYAYLSLSEHPSKALTAPLKAAVIGQNPDWQSAIMNLQHPNWQKHLRENAEQFKAQGFTGVFVDTLDSHQLIKKNTKQLHKQQNEAAVTLIRALGNLFDRNIILNRGFEHLEAIHKSVSAIAAESIIKGYSPSQGYFSQSIEDTQWVLRQLKRVQAKGLEAIAIDYVENPQHRAATAKKLIKLGVTPYVTDGRLESYGVSYITPVPNRVLALFDSQRTRLTYSPIFGQLSLPFERSGYPIDFHDLNEKTLPRHLAEYAAVIIWLPKHDAVMTTEFADWIARWKSQGPILWIDTPVSAAVQSQLAFNYAPIDARSNRQQWIFQDKQKLAGYESPLQAIRHRITQSIALGSGTQTPLFTLKTAAGSKTLLAKMSWGISAIKDSLFTTDPFHEDRWVVNPFVLIHELLGLPLIPVPDVTTETGRRVATAHIDGDGFPSRANFPGTPFTADVIHQEILERYTDIPTTVSVIEGEISAEGIHPEQADELETIAREIFTLPHVEIASHSFSHPFYWGRTPKGFTALYGRHLPIPNYTLNLEREVIGSLDYVNEQLAPANKKASVFLWSGYADPPESAITLAKSAGVENVNGGNTYVTEENFLLSNISPTLVPYDRGIQVLAPTMNENIYTDLWTRNFGGYARAIETFQLLDRDSRLKSIAIYYHMYSAEFPAALEALKTVYDWVLAQDINPMRLSDYARRARYSFDFALAQKTQSHDKAPHWHVVSQGVSTVRLPQALTTKSDAAPWARAELGVAGWRNIHGDTYVHVTAKKAEIAPKPRHDSLPYLHDSNGQILTWKKRSSQSSVYEIDFEMQAHAPLSLRFANADHCALSYQLITTKPGEDAVSATNVDHAEQQNRPDSSDDDNSWRQAKPHQSTPDTPMEKRLITFHLDKAPQGLRGRLTCNL